MSREFLRLGYMSNIPYNRSQSDFRYHDGGCYLSLRWNEYIMIYPYNHEECHIINFGYVTLPILLSVPELWDEDEGEEKIPAGTRLKMS